MKQGEYDDVTRVVAEKDCKLSNLYMYKFSQFHLFIYIVNYICSLFYMTLEASYIFLEDELVKDVEEGKITCVGKKEILTLALDTPEHLGRVRGKGGKKKKPKQFFNTPTPSEAHEEEECERMLREKVRTLEEEIIALKSKKKKEPLTPHFEVCNTNIRKQLLQHEEIRENAHYGAHVEDPSSQGIVKAFQLTQVYMVFPRLSL